MSRKATPDLLTNEANVLDAVLGAHLPDFSREKLRGVLAWIPVGRVYDNPFQTRQSYDDEHIQRLAENIYSLRDELPETLGMQQPPVARVITFGADGDAVPVDRNIYASGAAIRQLATTAKHAVEIHFGHNRLRAWRLLNERDGAYAEFPVFLAHADDVAMWRHAVSENAQRKDISAIEEAFTLRQAMQRFGLTQKQAGEPFGYAESTISNKLRLLDLPDDVQQMIMDGRLTERHGRELLPLNADPERVRQAAASAVVRQQTVKQLAEQVGYEARRLADDQKKARQIAKAQQILAAGYTPFDTGAPLPADRLDLDMETWKGHRLTAQDAGRCSADCPCLKVIHHAYANGSDISLDPDTPSMILFCANPDRHRELAEAVPPTAEAKAVQAQAVADKQRQLDERAAAAAAKAAEIQTEADRIWGEVLERCDRTTLWNSVDFWRMTHKTVDRSYYWWDKQLKDQTVVTVQELAGRILDLYKDDHKEYDTDAQRTTYNLDKLRKSAKALLKLAGAVPLSGGDTSPTTPIATLDQCIAAVWAHVKDIGGNTATRLETAKSARITELTKRLPLTKVDAEVMERARQRVVDDLAGQIAHAAKKAERRTQSGQSSTPPTASTWTDDDETSHQCLMSEWDGRSWATLAKLAYTCATGAEAPCTITANVARRLAADCPNADDRASLLLTAATIDKNFSREKSEAA